MVSALVPRRQRVTTATKTVSHRRLEVLVKINRFIAPSVVAAVVALSAGGWLVYRERTCDRLSKSISGDVQLKRGAGGQCYVCRDEGWLYDIAYRRCGVADRAYGSG